VQLPIFAWFGLSSKSSRLFSSIEHQWIAILDHHSDHVGTGIVVGRELKLPVDRSKGACVSRAYRVRARQELLPKLDD
jgi:hypothetical protein